MRVHPLASQPTPVDKPCNLRKLPAGVVIAAALLLPSLAHGGGVEVKASAAHSGNYGLEVTAGTLCTSEDDIVLNSHTVTGIEAFEACNSITSGSGFVVASGGDATFTAGSLITLQNGFGVDSGGAFTAVIDTELAAFAYVQDSSPDSEVSYRVEFYSNFDNVTVAGEDELDHFVAYSSDGSVELRLVVRSPSTLVLEVRDDTGVFHATSPVTFSSGWNKVALSWEAASETEVSVTLNDGTPSQVGGIDTHSQRIEYVRWGAVGVTPGVEGTLAMDDFASSFGRDPISLVFTDGFEPGDTSAWAGNSLPLDGVAPGTVVEGATFRVYSGFWEQGTPGVVFVDADPLDVEAPLAYPGTVQAGGYIQVDPDPMDLPASGGPRYVSIALDTDGSHHSLWANALQVVTAGDAESPLVVPNEEDVSCGGAGTECTHPILPGQTWRGEWGEAGDVDYFDFIAGSGAEVRVTLERVDTTLPPQHPDAPVPEIFLARPDGVIVAASEPLPLDATGTDLAVTLTMDGRYLVGVTTPKGSGQYLVALAEVSERATGAPGVGYVLGGTHITTPADPLTTLEAPVLDLFGHPVSAGRVMWLPGDFCGEGSFCATGSAEPTRTSVAGIAAKTITPQPGGSPLWLAQYVSSFGAKAASLAAREEVVQKARQAARAEPVLGFVSVSGSAVISADIPDPVRARQMAAIARRRASAAEAATAKGGVHCSSHTLTCIEGIAAFRAAQLPASANEQIVSVNLQILQDGSPVDELDGQEVLSTIPLTLQAVARMRDDLDNERDIPITDPVAVSVTQQSGAALAVGGDICSSLGVTPGAFDYLVGERATMSHAYTDELGAPCCWEPTEAIKAGVVAEVEVDDGAGGTTRVAKRAEAEVRSIPRPADPCEVRPLESSTPQLAAYRYYSSRLPAGALYIADACGNVVHGVGLLDSPDHDQPGDEFRITSPTNPSPVPGVWATAQSNPDQWSFDVTLWGNSSISEPIPDSTYDINLEVTSDSPECSAGGVITGTYSVQTEIGLPQVVLWWDWDSASSPRGPEPEDELISPGSALRDAVGAVGVWRVPAFDDGGLDWDFEGDGSYSSVAVKLYVVDLSKVSFDDDGNPDSTYFEPVDGVELCTGVVQKLTDASGYFNWNSPVRTTCDTTWDTVALGDATPDPPPGSPNSWLTMGLGVGLMRGPDQPGRYALVVEPVDEAHPEFRRNDAWKIDNYLVPDAFVEFDVGGGLFVDSNWEPIDPLMVDSPTQVHFLAPVSSMPEGVSEVVVSSYAQDGSSLSFEVPISLAPNAAATHLVGDIAAYPSGYEIAKSGTAGAKVLDLSGPRVDANLGVGRVEANLPNSLTTLAQTAFGMRGQLKLGFMTRDCSQLTPSPDPMNPDLAGTVQETEIGDSSDNYAEAVCLEISVRNPFAPTDPPRNIDLEVGIKEEANILYQEAQFYDRQDTGATAIWMGGAPWPDGMLWFPGEAHPRFLPITGGRGTVVLKSTALRRTQSGVVVRSSYLGNEGALVQPVVGSSSDPSPRWTVMSSWSASG